MHADDVTNLLPGLTAEAIEMLAGKWGGSGGAELWDDIRRLVTAYDRAAPTDRTRAWHHLVMAVGNFKRDGGRRLHPPRLSTPERGHVSARLTLPDGSTLDVDDMDTWAKLRIKGAGAPTKTALLGAVWPDRHFIYDRRVHRTANSLRILAGQLGTDDADPSSTKGGVPMERYAVVREWVLGCSEATAQPVTASSVPCTSSTNASDPLRRQVACGTRAPRSPQRSSATSPRRSSRRRWGVTSSVAPVAWNVCGQYSKSPCQPEPAAVACQQRE